MIPSIVDDSPLVSSRHNHIAMKPDISPYAYCAANPAAYADPSGLSPIYDRWGFHLGNSSEGFTGDILIYNGAQDPDFSNMTAEKIKREYSGEIFMYDGIKTDQQAGLYGYSHSRIWTHVVSQFEGQNFFGHTFSMDKIPGGIIFSQKHRDTWVTPLSMRTLTSEKIFGNGKFSYKPSVEALALSLIVHEWLTHIVMQYGELYHDHRYSYAYVMECAHLWNKVGEDYKQFVRNSFNEYSIQEGNAFTDFDRIRKEYILSFLPINILR